MLCLAVFSSFPVAPCTGAWIETIVVIDMIRCRPSLPVRERGLKHTLPVVRRHPIMSLPVRERGLKHKITYIRRGISLSLPVRKRRLKKTARTLYGELSPVGPVMGTWFEMMGIAGHRSKTPRNIFHWQAARHSTWPSAKVFSTDREVLQCSSELPADRRDRP